VSSHLLQAIQVQIYDKLAPGYMYGQVDKKTASFFVVKGRQMKNLLTSLHGGGEGCVFFGGYVQPRLGNCRKGVCAKTD
jgi:hypothetical protein